MTHLVKLSNLPEFISQIRRNSIGLDSLFDDLFTQQEAISYPPYNIAQIDENTYELELALAGFSKEDIDIVVEGSKLTISGKKEEKDQKEKDYLYRGLAQRQFSRTIYLENHIEVKSAKMVNGVLTINVVREIPDRLKPKQITIG